MIRKTLQLSHQSHGMNSSGVYLLGTFLGKVITFLKLSVMVKH